MMENYVSTALLKKAWGLKGYIAIASYSGEYDHIHRLKNKYVFLKNKDSDFIKVKIKDVSRKDINFFIKIENIDNPEDAKLYNGYSIYVDKSLAVPLNKGEYYFYDLEGCILIKNEEKKGEVISLLDLGHNIYLEVKNEDQKPFLVPFSKDFIGEVDLKKKTIELLYDDFI